jgi:hypothetical protein
MRVLAMPGVRSYIASHDRKKPVRTDGPRIG